MELLIMQFSPPPCHFSGPNILLSALFSKGIYIHTKQKLKERKSGTK
jgi:hypothetical protein